MAENTSYWHGALQTRLHRRRLMAAGVSLAGASAILAACGGGGSGSSANNSSAKAAPAAKAKPGGTVTFSVAAQFGNLNPQGVGGSSQVRDYVNDRLFNYDYQNQKYELSMASTLEQPDATTIVFKVNPKAKYQQVAPTNGRAVTAQDVVTSWSNYRDSTATVGAKTIWTMDTDKLEAPDSSTVRVVLKQPNTYAIGPHGLAGPYPSLVTAPELWANNQLNTKAVGAGAYLLDQFDAASTLSFVRRPDGWNGLDRPYADKVVFKVITDSTAQAAAFRAKQIDFLTANDKIQADEFKTYGPDMQIDVELGFPRMFWLRADKGPFADVRAREAVYKTLDIKELIDRVDLGEAQWTSPVPAHLPNYALPDSELKTQFPVDRAKAADLLKAAGFDFSHEFEFKVPNDDKSTLLATVLQKQLAAANIKTKIIPQDPRTVFTQTLANKDLEIAAAYVQTLGQDANVWVGSFSNVQGGGQGSPTAWNDPKIDDMVVAQRHELDPAKQKQMVLDIERAYFKVFSPTINLVTPNNFVAHWNYFHPDRTHGYVGLLAHYQWTEKPA
ncbi:MAG TPA: ABC transporter substrate-binding protein [Dehalococcoidia bacterium]